MKKPNLLFLYTDEQAVNTLAAYGNARIEVPSLNALSNESTVFEQAYVTQPVCTPSRSTLMTGLYPHVSGCTRNNVALKKETKCCPELLSDNDYKAAHFGKWHLGDEIFKQHGFDEWISIDAYYHYYSNERDKNRKSDYHKFLIKNGFQPADGNRFGRWQTACFPEKFSKPAFLAKESKHFIEENKDRPFALYLSTPEGWRRLLAYYWGLCSLVDTYVGEIVNKLKECGIYDDTVVVFTSDHGDMMGSHGLLAKCVMFEEAVRVPFFVKFNGQSKTRKVKGLVSQIDIIPTLLDLMGKKIPETIDGKSLKHLVKNGGRVPDDNNVFVEWFGTDGLIGDHEIPECFKDRISDIEELNTYFKSEVCTIIIPNGWKYNWSPIGEDELYNLNVDKNEINNLAYDYSQKGRVNKSREKIQEWKNKTNYQQP